MNPYICMWRFPVSDNLVIEVEDEELVSGDDSSYVISLLRKEPSRAWTVVGGLESKEDAFEGAHNLTKVIHRAGMHSGVGDITMGNLVRRFAWDEYLIGGSAPSNKPYPPTIGAGASVGGVPVPPSYYAFTSPSTHGMPVLGGLLPPNHSMNQIKILAEEMINLSLKQSLKDMKIV